MILFTSSPADPRGFEVHPIDRELAIGPGGTVTPLEASEASRPDTSLAWLVPWRDRKSPRRGVVLLSRSFWVTVNGRCALPLLVLRRGDEIRVDGASLFYSDEAPLQVVSFAPGSENGWTPESAECTRCHGPIKPGDPVVFCPACGALYMAQENDPPNCWEFGPCVCGRDPKREFSWQPRGLAIARPWQNRPWRALVTAGETIVTDPSLEARSPE